MKRENISFSIVLVKSYTCASYFMIKKLILTQQALRHYRMECNSFWTEFIKLLYSNKMTNMVLIQLLQNGLGEHYNNLGGQLQPVL